MNYIKGWLLAACLAKASWTIAAAPDTLILSASQPAGLYSSAMSLSLMANDRTATIYYTTDGSKPTTGSRRFVNPIALDSNVVVQAVAYKGEVKSEILVASYIFNENTKLPVVSLAIEPEILFNSATGIFKLGARASKSFPHFGANYYTNKEFTCHIEFFETDKSLAFSQFMGFKIFGGMSRIFPQKSLALVAREQYGKKRVKHEIFPDRPLKSYKSFVLRNSGSDFGETHFRDAFITSLGREMGLEVQAYRPSIVYINGKFWGILNLREKLNKTYLSDHFGYDKDSIDLMEHRQGVQAGSRKHYEAMQNYMRNNDLSEQRHFDHVAQMMDVENFMDYEIVEIYIDNQDAGGNIKFWRPQKPDGRWRWILFDTDFGFGHYGKLGYKQNSLAFHTEPNGPSWPNPAWSTFNLRMLLKNKGFRDAFVLRFLDRINTTFDSTHCIRRIDSMSNHITPDIFRHIQRWELDEKRWHTEVARMREFARERPKYMRQFLREMFPHVGDEVKLRIEIEGEGSVVLNNTATVSDSLFVGTYFENLPVRLAAKPTMRSQFSHWENMGKRVDEKSFKLNFKDTLQVVKAVFKSGAHPMAQAVIINELGCHDTLAGDWIELFNNSNEAVNLKGWTMYDAGGNRFVFGDVTLAANGYLVLAQHLKQFQKAYPACANAVGDFGFGLDKKSDKVELFDADGAPVDSVAYKLAKSLKDEKVVLALLDCTADNGDFENWQLEEKGGSPGAINPRYIATAKAKEIGNVLKYAMYAGLGLASVALIAVAYSRVRKNLKRRNNANYK